MEGAVGLAYAADAILEREGAVGLAYAADGRASRTSTALMASAPLA